MRKEINLAKKKLLFLVNVDWFFVSHRLPIAIEAKKNGYDVHIACAFTDKFSYLKNMGFTLHEIPFLRNEKNVIGEIKSVWKTFILLSSLKPDIMHAITIKPILYGLMAVKYHKHICCVAAFSGLGLVFVESGLIAKIRKEIVKYIYKFTFKLENLKVIFQNPSDLEVINDILRLRKSDYTLIKGAGVDLTAFRKVPEVAGTPVIVMASRLLKEKGVYEFLEAARIVKERGVICRFVLAGDIDIGNPNSLTIDELSLIEKAGYVELIGYCCNIYELFSKSHIVVLPSYYGEGLPKVLIEAAACGRAIITTNNPGCSDSVIPEKTGLVVPIKDAYALSDAITRLVLDGRTRKEMGEMGRLYAEKEFDIRSVVEKHLAIYKELYNRIR